MFKVDVYSVKGTKTGKISLPKDFEEKENLHILSQAIRVYSDRAHPGLAKVQTRAEVNRTTKKWYRQKGTGGARHGARSAPIFVGGGVAHGPKGVKRSLSLSLRMKKKALGVSLFEKAKERELIVVAGLGKLKKTKEVANLAKKLSKKKFTFVFGNEDLGSTAAFRNFKAGRVMAYKDLNAMDVFYGGMLVFDKSIFMKSRQRSK